jgi:hypothetical protein
MEFINKLDINGVITLLAIIAYIVVFVIKKSEIEKQKTIIASMKSFMEIFKVDEVRKFVEMKEETTEINMKNYLNNDENLNKLINEFAENLESKYRNEFNEKLKNRYEELFVFSVKILISSNEKDRETLYKSLKNNRENIEQVISDSNNKNNL